MADAALAVLWAQTQVFTLGVLLVALLRLPLRHAFGARAAHPVWILVPTLALAALWPRAAELAPLQAVGLGLVQPVPRAAASVVPGAADGVSWALVGMGAWALGAAAMLGALLQGHRRLRRLLLADAGHGVWQLPAGHSPALVGLWRPCLALPVDFERLFSAAERRAILLHEAAHARRGDNCWNLLAQALMALFWFHPLAWWALHRHRADQELACDAAALAVDDPPSLHDYAQALVKAQNLDALWPASNWRSTHPLIERITMLQSHRLSAWRQRAGRGLVATLVLAALAFGPALHAAPPGPPGPQNVMVHITLEQDGRPVGQPRLFGALGQAMSLRWQTDAASGWAERWELSLNATQVGPGQLQFDTRLSRGEPLQPMVRPRLVTAVGEPARVEVRSDDGLHTLSISLMGQLADQPDQRREP